MWIALIVLLPLLALLIWILVAPIQLIIDSTIHRYELRWGGLARLAWYPQLAGWPIHYQIMLWKRSKNMEDFLIEQASSATTATKKTEEKKEKPSRKKRARKWAFAKVKRKIVRLLRSFQILRCQLNIDTDDYCRNAFLYPIFHFLKSPRRQLNINFQGQTKIQLTIQNRAIRILHAFIF